MSVLRKYRAALFDLDGVIVDTAKYHYLAWKRLAQELGLEFTERENERFKGVSRDRCLEMLLDSAGLEQQLSPDQKKDLADRKNGWYLEYLRDMTAAELLPGAESCVASLRGRGIKLALCTASKNAPLILSQLGIASWFDAVVDGNRVTKAKPDPEVFLRAAEELSAAPEECVVFEDAQAGIEAAKAGGMYAVGIGDPRVLTEADRVIKSLADLDVDDLFCAGGGVVACSH